MLARAHPACIPARRPQPRPAALVGRGREIPTPGTRPASPACREDRATKVPPAKMVAMAATGRPAPPGHSAVAAVVAVVAVAVAVAVVAPVAPAAEVAAEVAEVPCSEPPTTACSRRRPWRRDMAVRLE